MAAAVKAALVGTGRMGGAMAGRLTAGGADLVVHNRTRATAEAVAGRTGASVAGSAAAAVAAADVVVVSLADDTAVRETYLGPEGIVAGLRHGTVVCDTSTVAPATPRGLARVVAERGASLLDTPVSGSVPVVERGELMVMAGGDAVVLERARPALETFATRIFHLGAVGAGATAKLVVNALVHALDVSVSEALVLAELAGLEREQVYDVFEASAVAAPFVRYKRTAFVEPESAPVAFSLDLVAKDLGLIHDLAEAVGARMDQADTNRTLVAEAVSAGLGQEDMSAVAQHLRAGPGR